MRTLVALAAIFLTAIDPAAALAQLTTKDGVERSVVRLYCMKEEQTTKGNYQEIGAGFFVSDDGKLVTAYHVVQGATSVLALGGIEDVYKSPRVLKYDENWDLALLQFDLPPSKKVRPLPLAQAIPVNLSGRHSIVVGHPNGMLYHRIGLTFTKDFELSQAYSDDIGDRIFAVDDVKLLSFDGTTLGGMSGGPVILAGEVVGVMSGSLAKGRTMGWAIPVTRLKDMASLREPLASFDKLPELKMLRRGLRLSRNVGSPLEIGELSVYVRMMADVETTLKQAREKVDELKRANAEVQAWNGAVDKLAGPLRVIDGAVKGARAAYEVAEALPAYFIKPLSGRYDRTVKSMAPDTKSRLSSEARKLIQGMNELEETFHRAQKRALDFGDGGKEQKAINEELRRLVEVQAMGKAVDREQIKVIVKRLFENATGQIGLSHDTYEALLALSKARLRVCTEIAAIERRVDPNDVGAFTLTEDKRSRCVWSYDGGWLSTKDGKTWMEHSYNIHSDVGAPFEFTEIKRTAQYVELYDAKRKLTVRLYEAKMEVNHDGKYEWYLGIGGRWVSKK